MKKYVLFVIVIMLFLSGCDNAVKLNIIFDDIGKLGSNTLVYHNDNAIGKVNDVVKNENGKYNVKIYIDSQYNELITDKTQFYLISKDDEPQIIMMSEKGNELKDNAVFEGRDELAYRIRQAMDALKDMVGSIMDSEEWEILKKNINEFAEKGYEEGTKHFPRINENLQEFFNQFNEQYGEKLKMNIGPYLDSLIEDLNSIGKTDE